MCSQLPGRLLGLVVVHDDVGVFGRAGCVEVELLGRDVALAPTPLDLGGGAGRRAGPGSRARSSVFSNGTDTKMRRSHRSISSGRRRKTPSKSRTAPAGAVVTGGDSAVSVAVVVDRVLVPAVSARAQRIEQNPVQRPVVGAVVIAALGRVLATPVALCPGEEEVSIVARMTSRPCARRTTASSSASVVLPAAGGPSMATRVGCATVTDPTASARRLSSSSRVPWSMSCRRPGPVSFAWRGTPPPVRSVADPPFRQVWRQRRTVPGSPSAHRLGRWQW